MKHLLTFCSALVGVLVIFTGAFAKTEISISNMSDIPEYPALAQLTHYVSVAEPSVRTTKETVLVMLSDAGIDTAKAERIIFCESSWNPRATNLNRNGSNDKGLWQLNSVHGLSDEVRLDPIKSTEFAIKLIKKQGFKPWVCSK